MQFGTDQPLVSRDPGLPAVRASASSVCVRTRLALAFNCIAGHTAIGSPSEYLPPFFADKLVVLSAEDHRVHAGIDTMLNFSGILFLCFYCKRFIFLSGAFSLLF